MNLKVTITYQDGHTETKDFRSWITLAAWLEAHNGEYREVDAHWENETVE